MNGAKNRHGRYPCVYLTSQCACNAGVTTHAPCASLEVTHSICSDSIPSASHFPCRSCSTAAPALYVKLLLLDARAHLLLRLRRLDAAPRGEKRAVATAAGPGPPAPELGVPQGPEGGALKRKENAINEGTVAWTTCTRTGCSTGT